MFTDSPLSKHTRQLKTTRGSGIEANGPHAANSGILLGRQAPLSVANEGTSSALLAKETEIQTGPGSLRHLYQTQAVFLHTVQVELCYVFLVCTD